MSNILAVGIATVDIVNTVKDYPQEDDELRAVNQTVRRGGNATNSLVVLSQLGHQCAWAGVIADDIYASVIRRDLTMCTIVMDWVVEATNSVSPVSCITLNEANGSRTIVHYRDLPEYSFADFSRINLSGFDWLHFEGRNVGQTLSMLRLVHSSCTVPISIEIEKPRDDIESLYEFADILFFSRVFVRHLGYDSAEPFLKAMHLRYPQIEHYCAWGEVGAYAVDRDGVLHFADIPSSVKVLDSIGAGDVFNAAVINAKINQLSCSDSLRRGSQLATKKCAQYGFDGLVEG